VLAEPQAAQEAVEALVEEEEQPLLGAIALLVVDRAGAALMGKEARQHQALSRMLISLLAVVMEAIITAEGHFGAEAQAP
jgi:hypothetical protein